MIATLRNLSTSEQRQLLGLLGGVSGPDELADDEVFGELLSTLRSALDVPDNGDLPQYLRRRLVDVAIEDYGLVPRHDADQMTELELAHLVVDFVLDSAAEIAEDEERREDLASFLRTKSTAERRRLLTDSQRFAAHMKGIDFDRAMARQKAGALSRKSDPNQGLGAHEKTAHQVARDLGTSAAAAHAAQVARAVEVGSGMSKGALAGGAAGGAVAGTSAALAGLGAAAGMATLSAAALPAAAVGGAIFMAGRQRRKRAQSADRFHELARTVEGQAPRPDPKVRAQRARRSKLVQTVVILSTFLVAVSPSDPS